MIIITIEAPKSKHFSSLNWRLWKSTQWPNLNLWIKFDRLIDINIEIKHESAIEMK